MLEVTDASSFGLRPEHSVYDVALLLGIGAMTVCQDERTALQKLRAIFAELRVSRVGELDFVGPKLFRHTLRNFGLSSEKRARRYPLSRAWHPVSRIISISGGIERVRDVVLTHQFLNERDPSTFRPPVFTRVGGKTQRIGSVGRALEFDGAMRMQIQLSRLSKRRLHLQSEFTVLVESEFGRDSSGEFEVPIIVAVFAVKPIGSRRDWNGEGPVGGARGN